jgi:hypothetical protein
LPSRYVYPYYLAFEISHPNQTLILLAKSKSEDYQRLVQAVYGVVFFGVPHEGMGIDSLIPMVGDGPNRFLIESIGRVNSQILNTQQREFHTALGSEGDSEIFCFFETVESPTAIQVCHIYLPMQPNLT